MTIRPSKVSGSGVYTDTPEGAFYTWAKFSIGHMQSDEIAKFLLKEANIICVPGKAYCDRENNYVRFSFATEQKQLENAIERIKNMMNKI